MRLSALLLARPQYNPHNTALVYICLHLSVSTSGLQFIYESSASLKDQPCACKAVPTCPRHLGCGYRSDPKRLIQRQNVYQMKWLTLNCRTAAKGKRHPVQLSEWWADFDERVMRPVFNKPDALDSWTPRSDGAKPGTPCSISFMSRTTSNEGNLGSQNCP